MTDLSLSPSPFARFRPAAPPPLDREPTLFEMLRPSVARNLINAIPRTAFEQPYRRVRIAGLTYHGISDPDAIKRVFLDNAANYQRPDLVRRMLRPAVGEGLLNAEHEAWKSQRRLMAPVFQPQAVAAFAPLFAELAHRSAARVAGGGVIDMAAEATRTTLEVIDEALFSGESGMTFDETEAYVRDFLAGMTELRLPVLLGLTLLDGGPAQRRARLARRMLVRRMAAFVHRRADEAEPRPDFVSRLYQAFLAEHPRDKAIQLTLDNAMTFFLAGHETTANGLAWALYLLSCDRQAQAWAREEAREAWEAGGDPACVLARLPYLKMVWDETLRLYPPAHRIDRQAVGEDVLCGQPIRPGDMISVWPWVLHRHKTLWPDPEVFNPENFDPEARATHHRYQYIPFGAGPRTCIGAGFAQAEALILLSRWLAGFRFQPAPGHAVRPRADFTLRPDGGLPLVVEPLA
jgi:cytochrome P450